MPEAIGDKTHERHAEIREWVGGGFDPKVFDPEPLKADVAALAKRWSRKPAPKKSRPAYLRGSPDGYFRVIVEESRQPLPHPRATSTTSFPTSSARPHRQ
jgi:hypothetical protein